MADYDPSKIDVSLSLLSGADSAAAKDLAAQLKASVGHFDSIDKSMKSYVTQLEKIANKLSEITAAQSSGTSGGASTPHAAAAHAAGVPPPGTTEAAARAAAAQQGQLFDPTPGPPEQGSLFDPPGPIPGGGASTPPRPPGVGPDQTGGQEGPPGVGPDETGAQGPGGASNPPHPLDLLGGGSGASWIKRAYDFGPGRLNPEKGVGKGISKAAEVIGQATGGSFDEEAQERLRTGESSLLKETTADPMRAHFAFQNVQGIAKAMSSRFQEPYYQQAVSQGYERGGQVEVGGIGMNVPGLRYLQGGAGKEAWQSKERELWMRKQAGINSKEAKHMQADLAESGLGTGTMADGINRIMASAFKKHGIDSSVMKNFFGQLRNGSSSLKDVNDQLDSLGTAAKGAGINVNEMAAEVAAVGELNQQTGGTFAGGVNKATAFTNATGMAPSKLGELAQSPMVSGLLTAQTGLAPQQQGLIGTTGVMGGIDQAFAMAKASSKGLGRDIKSPIIDPQTGKARIGKDGKPVFETISKQDQEDSFAANQMGTDLETYQKYDKNRKQIAAGGALEGMLKEDKIAKKFSWSQIIDAGGDAGISKKQMEAIGGKKGEKGTYGSRREGVEKILAEKNRDRMGEQVGADKIGVEISLSKEAKRWFGADVKENEFWQRQKAAAAAGEGTTTDGANTTQGKNPLHRVVPSNPHGG